MHVAVLGAGVIGVTTAYYLAEQGHRVTLVERAAQPASETSHANGAQLSYSYTDPLAQPSMPARLPTLLLGRDPAIRMKPLHDLSLSAWGLQFLKECTAARSRANMLSVLRIALRSARLLSDIRERVPLEFGWRRAGKIVVFDDPADLPGVKERTQDKQNAGCDIRTIGFDEAVRLEPALAAMQQSFAGAVYAPDDEVGDAAAFAAGLLDWLRRERDVDLRFGRAVESVDYGARGLRAICLEGGEFFPVDAAVVALGPWSRDFLRPLGISLPICRIRGYSVTLPATAESPNVSITNVSKRIVFSRLGNRIRIAGFADFVGASTRNDRGRICDLMDVARRVAPQAADYQAENHHPWGGFRPVTPDSQPRVGRTAVPGLYLNAGHGVLGWTLACATAEEVANAVSAGG